MDNIKNDAYYIEKILSNIVSAKQYDAASLIFCIIYSSCRPAHNIAVCRGK